MKDDTQNDIKADNKSEARPAALVTGGSIRIGRAIGIALAKRGYDIALHYNSSAHAAAETVREIEQRGVRCKLFQLAFGEVDSFEPFVQTVCATFPNLAVLINSAAAFTQATIMDSTPELFDREMAVNLKTPFFLTQAFARVCGSGHVVNLIDSKVAQNQYQYAIYLLSKKALAEFTKMAAVELAPQIRVNGVAPGIIILDAPKDVEETEAYFKWRLDGVPLKRQGDLKNIADTVLFFIDNEFITGQIITIDGGESITNVGLNAAAYKENS